MIIIKNQFAQMQKIAVILRRVVRNFKYAKLLVPALVILFCLSCGKKNEPEAETETEESLLPPNLKGTKWKVEGIWYEESAIFWEPKVDLEEWYVLIFNTDTTAHTSSYVRSIYLNFSGKIVQATAIDFDGFNELYIDPSTGMIVADPFAHIYSRVLSALRYWSYSITESEMKLYFPEPSGSIDGYGPKLNSFNSYFIFKKVK